MLFRSNVYGRAYDVQFIGKGKSSLDAVIERHATLQERVVKPDQMPYRGFYYRSDQFAFAKIGVPAFFLDPDAAGPFAGLIERQQAAIVDIAKLVNAIAQAPMPVRPRHMAAPPLEETLLRLDAMADDYARLCERSGTTG